MVIPYNQFEIFSRNIIKVLYELFSFAKLISYVWFEANHYPCYFFTVSYYNSI